MYIYIYGFCCTAVFYVTGSRHVCMCTMSLIEYERAETKGSVVTSVTSALSVADGSDL